MAKDLPYFKFFVSEWSDGDITLEDYSVQGVFINVCAYYWSNGCVVSYEKLCKKFKGCGTELTTLKNANIIKIDGGIVYINFLDEQLGERDKLSKQNRINALKRWTKSEPSEKDATASRPHSESDAIKIREEEIREEKNRSFDLFWERYGKKGTKKKSIDKWMKLKQPEIDKAFKVVDAYVKSTPDKQYRKGLESWIYNECWNDEIEITKTHNPNVIPSSNYNYTG